MMSESTRQSRLSPRLLTTLAIGTLFVIVVGLVKVPTSLGIKVSRPAFGEPDLSGREYIWRVWWRARDDLIDVEPQWLLTGGLIGLLAIFAAGMMLAIWLVTGPATDDDIAPADG